MKSLNNKTALLICIMLLTCSLSVMAKRNVERGMTKDQVMEILGKPENTSFDETGEIWEYIKTPLLGNYVTRILVFFGRDNQVRAYQSSTIDGDTNAPVGYGRRPGVCPNPPAVNPGYYELDNESFSVLYNKVKDASFDSNRFDLIEVACLGCWFNCCQVASLFKLFSFSDSKFKVLRMMAPRIVDPQNASDIYRVFDFSSDKDKAADILSGR